MAAPEIDSADGIKVGGVLIQSGTVNWTHGASSHTDRTRAFLVSAFHGNTGGESTKGVLLDSTSVEAVSYRFMLPADFVSITSVKILWMSDNFNAADEDWVLDITTKYGEINEGYAAHGVDDLNNVINIPAYEVSKNRAFQIDSGVFTSMGADDIVLIEVERDAIHASDTFTEDVVIMGIIVTYTADM